MIREHKKKLILQLLQCRKIEKKTTAVDSSVPLVQPLCLQGALVLDIFTWLIVNGVTFENALM